MPSIARTTCVSFGCIPSPAACDVLTFRNPRDYEQTNQNQPVAIELLRRHPDPFPQLAKPIYLTLRILDAPREHHKPCRQLYSKHGEGNHLLDISQSD